MAPLCLPLLLHRGNGVRALHVANELFTAGFVLDMYIWLGPAAVR